MDGAAIKSGLFLAVSISSGPMIVTPKLPRMGCGFVSSGPQSGPLGSRSMKGRVAEVAGAELVTLTVANFDVDDGFAELEAATTRYLNREQLGRQEQKRLRLTAEGRSCWKRG